MAHCFGWLQNRSSGGESSGVSGNNGPRVWHWPVGFNRREQNILGPSPAPTLQQEIETGWAPPAVGGWTAAAAGIQSTAGGAPAKN